MSEWERTQPLEEDRGANRVCPTTGRREERQETQPNDGTSSGCAKESIVEHPSHKWSGNRGGTLSSRVLDEGPAVELSWGELLRTQRPKILTSSIFLYLYKVSQPHKYFHK